MRVLHVITGLGSGGAEAVLYRLCQFENTNEHIVVSLRSSGKYAVLLKQLGVQIYVLDISNWKNCLPKFFQLINLIKSLKPDIVQTWLYHADLIGGMAARFAGIRKIYWGIHNTTLSKSRTPVTTRKIVEILALLSYCIPQKIIVCAETARLLHIHQGYDGDKMLVINNGYDVNTFKPNLSQKRIVDGVHYDTPLLGMVARYAPQKDIGNLFQALAIIKNRGISFRCMLVGSNMDYSNRELVDLIEKQNLEDRLILKGERNDLQNIMPALDLLILSSAFGEAFPNVICEAMACGVPCVTTDLGDCSSIVADLGWVVQPSDPSQLAYAIDRALQTLHKLDPDQIRAKIVKNYSIEKMVNSYTSAWMAKE